MAFQIVSRIHQVSRFLRTVRHLRYSQIAHRGRRLTRQFLASPQGPRAFAPSFVCQDRWTAEFPFVPLAECEVVDGELLVEQLELGIFEHLNQSHYVGLENVDWRLGKQKTDRLWSVTLHYHRWAYDLARVTKRGDRLAARAERLLVNYLSDWIRHCDVSVPGARSLAWNPYTIATRIGWWIRCLCCFDDDFRQRNDDFVRRVLCSLWKQADYLHQHLEWDLRANHLLRDAVGLAWAGRFFWQQQRGEAEVAYRPQHGLRTATRVAVEQAREQVLSDGGHFERSPMYHLAVMNDWLALAVLLKEPKATELMRSAWHRMAAYIAWLRHPDGAIPQFNDAAISCPDDYLRLGKQIGIDVDLAPRRGAHEFHNSGVVAWHGEPWTVFFDVGEIGPMYQPGHAHADTLTLECSYNGRRLFVDPGCGNYDLGAARRYDRSTSAHNTVCIDDTDSSEVWHIFRVGRRARPREVHVALHGASIEATASHTGYDHLPGNPRHRRKLTVCDNGPLVVVDRLDGRRRHQATGGFLLAPHWKAVPATRGWLVSRGKDCLLVTVDGPDGMQLCIKQRPFHPDFGMEVQTERLQWTYEGVFPIDVRVLVRRASQMPE